METKQEKESYVAPKLFVDEAATEVQQIYFYAGTKPPSVEVLDAVDSSSVDSSEYLMRVDPYRAITEIDYFVRGISTCEAKMTRKILERKIAPVLKSSELTAEELKSLPPKEYLFALPAEDLTAFRSSSTVTVRDHVPLSTASISRRMAQFEIV